jgi:hypothetical protein
MSMMSRSKPTRFSAAYLLELPAAASVRASPSPRTGENPPGTSAGEVGQSEIPRLPGLRHTKSPGRRWWWRWWWRHRRRSIRRPCRTCRAGGAAKPVANTADRSHASSMSWHEQPVEDRRPGLHLDARQEGAQIVVVWVNALSV